MAGYKETPRQKMIAMMYLVLTALLALNVSKDILEAFLIVNESMQTTNENFVKKVDGSYASFNKALAENPGKVQAYYNKAMQAKKMSTDLVKFLEDTRTELIARSDKIPMAEARVIDLRKVKTRDKWDFATHYFIGDSQDGSKGKAREIKDRINDYKEQIVNLVDPKYRHMLKIGLSTEDVDNKIQGTKNWEMYNFYHTILAADVVILNKLIAEVKNAEFDIVSQLYAEVSIEDFKFDQIAAKVVPKSNYVLVGEEYEAEIFVAAYNTKDNPDVQIVLGADTPTVENLRNAMPIEGDKGVVIYKQPASAEGVQKYAGVINIRTPGGGIKSYPFKNEYVVARPSAIVSADKMNVFYIGVDNPVSISVPGVPAEKIRPSIRGGQLIPSKGRGKYIVRVKRSEGNKAVINVSADFNGQLRSMGSSEFRVKRVPDPIPYIAGQNEGPVSKAAILAAGGIIPRMENFDFDLNFIVTSFSMVTSVKGDLIEKTAQGNRLTQEMGSILNRAVRGQKVWFENIRAKGPDGTIRKLPAIAVKIM